MKYIPEPEWRFDEESYGGVYFTHKQRRIRRNHYLYRRKYHNTLDEKKTEKETSDLAREASNNDRQHSEKSDASVQTSRGFRL